MRDMVVCMNEKQANSIDAYLAAWNGTSDTELDAALNRCTTADLTYCDPFTETAYGVNALADVVLGVGRRFPGVTHELIGAPLVHHDVGCYRWIARVSSTKEIPGIDYVEFAADSRIKRVESFTNEADWR